MRFAQTAPIVLAQIFEALKSRGYDSFSLEKLMKLELLNKGANAKVPAGAEGKTAG